MHNGEETVRFAPRNNPRRKRNEVAPVRRSLRNVAGKAYSNTRPPTTVTPYPSVHDQVHHPVPFLDGQDDIPRSDDEGDSMISSQRMAPEQRQETPNLREPIELPSMPDTTSPGDPPHVVPGIQQSTPAAQITPIPACPELPTPENLPDPVDSGPILAPNHPVPPNQLTAGQSNGPLSASGNATVAPNSPLVPHLARNLENLEQWRNEREHRLALLESALLYGPSKRHVNNYTSNLYARTKPQIYVPNPKAADGPDNSKKYQGSFSIAEQILMYPAEHSMLYDLVCVDPFPIDDATVTRGFIFARSMISTTLNGEGPSLALKHFMMKKLSRKRNSMLALVQSGILDKYGLPPDAIFDDLDAYHRVVELMQNDSFVDMASAQSEGTAKFTHPAIAFVLKTLLFKTKPPVGLLFIDRIASSDTEALWHNTRSDQSPEALRGIPIGAIAFACILVSHKIDFKRAWALLRDGPHHYR
ncbi:hypothetical protein RSOLAG22IIIB_06826 [Rhizoctonia solani]|uniref:DUF6532 domain-containing protein n=1 Tax=Rhizoctonia solani TaxID=456999 RepID=A0A0K6GGW0_9AGAM|nr:hypothetical protein RSOLAG22IIIB_06826 [Rhizoctonia solani]